MKSKITFFLILLTVSYTIAQNKVGTINSDFIIGKMPQTKVAMERTDKFAKKLDSSFQVKVAAYNAKIKKYKAELKSFSEETKKSKMVEIAEIENELTKLRKNGPTLIKIRRDEYMRPLYKKMTEAIKVIAKEQGYTQILTTGGNEFAYIDEKHDITKKVLDKMGLKE